MTAPCTTLEKYDATTIDLPNAAKLIAEEIRLHGHYQSTARDLTGGSDVRACLVANHVFPYMPDEIKRQLAAEIVDRAKHGTGFPQNRAPFSTPYNSMVIWNDNAPTEQVLEVLDAIAAPALVADRG